LIWKKPINTSLLNFNTLCPQKWKFDLNVCTGMLVCAKRICSNVLLYNAELKRLKQIYFWQSILLIFKTMSFVYIKIWDLLHLIKNVFMLTPALTLTLKRNYVFGLTK